MQENYTYDLINNAWKSTCKIILGESIGELKDYEKMLLGNAEQLPLKKSMQSKKEVVLFSKNYPESANFLSFDEIDFNKKYDAIDLNKIKDIDSIISELQDRFVYTGNVILGNCKYIEKSTNVMDSFYVYQSGLVDDSKYVACSSLIRSGENAFGSNLLGESKYVIGISDVYRCSRLFDCYFTLSSSDSYCSFAIENCQECMFCFNVKSKKYCIGNLELEKGKYLELKKKLLGEIAESMKKGKDVFLYRLLENIKLDYNAFESKEVQKFNATAFESEFSKTAELLFGRQISGITSGKLGQWLLRHKRKMQKTTSRMSGKPIYLADYCNLLKFPKGIFITDEDALKAMHFKLNEKEVESLSIKNPGQLAKLAYLMPNYRRMSSNYFESGLVWMSKNVYRSIFAIRTKNTAHSFWPRDSSNIYGADIVFLSFFCINCYNSKNLSRCFECDSCENCTDLYFSHNCENVHDSMFCFNVKNKRNAIGNVEYPKEQYAKIKKMLLEKISKELGQKNSLELSIFNLAKGKKKK